eukprot:scaffold6031_cov72-Cyclotella_meneghiniana.AAC.7
MSGVRFPSLFALGSAPFFNRKDINCGLAVRHAARRAVCRNPGDGCADAPLDISTFQTDSNKKSYLGISNTLLSEKMNLDEPTHTADDEPINQRTIALMH